MGLIEQVARYDDHVRELLAARHEKYAKEVAASIRQMQRKGLADKKLDPAVAAAAVGALTGRFAEMWLVDGRVDDEFDAVVEQVTRFLVNALGISAAR
jgi:hypothetical protein